MKKLGLILAVGFGMVSCRQASFIAEDDVYSPSRGFIAASDGSDASYSTYVYSQQGSGTKSAYYNPDDTTQQNQQYTDTRQQGTTVINNYYGHDPIYANGWHGYSAFGYPYNSFHSPWRYGYRSRWVWYGWGYDPFFYGYYSPWNSWCAFGGGWGYGWGHNPYMYGYNPYAWGHGYGYNPYGWGGGWGHNPYAWGGGNTIIYGNVYNIYGNQGISAGSGNTVTGSGLIQNGNNFIGKRPTNAAQTTPYSGINKTKSALDASGKPKEVKNITAKRENTETVQVGKNNLTNLKNEPRQVGNQTSLSSQQLASSSKPWTPETISTSSRNNVNKPGDNQQNTVQPRQIDQQVNRPSVPNKPAVDQPNRPTTQPAVNQGRPSSNPNNETVRPQTNPNNQWNRNTTPQNREVSPNPAPRQQMNSPQPSRPSGGSINNSPSRPSGGSMNSPSRSGGSSGGSFNSGGSPRSGGSVGGGSRGGRP
jgi:uncharacterized membrane protein YgcG